VRKSARWLPLAANLGALIGVTLIVVQLQQNRLMMRTQVRHELSTVIVELLNSWANNGQLAGVLRRGNLGEPLTPDELMQYNMRNNALFRYWENVHYQYRQGLYDRVEFMKHKDAWRATFASGVGATAYWCQVRTLYSPLFMAEMDGLIPTKC
jgi:hypothetical protein